MAYCYSRYYGTYYCRSRWNSWGRWVLLGCILAAALLIFLLFACITARRRRRIGRKPFYGTGWVAPNGSTKPQMQQQGYNNNNYNNTATYQTSGQQQQYGANPYSSNAPPYNSTTQQTYGGQNAEYYGGSTAQSGQYQPPSYPPPAQTRN